MIEPVLKAKLTRSVSRFLLRLEDLFGPRDRRFPSVEVDRWESVSKGPSQIYSAVDGRVTIMITAHVSNLGALWELAHECVHLLNPWIPDIEGMPTNVLEEGLASWFQNCVAHESRGELLPAYARAEALVRPHMVVLPPAIRRLREQGVRIGEINPSHLHRVVDSATAEQLCQRWAG